MSRKINQIIVHHTADSSTAHQFKKINKFHKSRGFPRSTLGLYIGYHYLIEHDGFVWQTRQDYEIGAHDKGENLNSIGIGLSGNFNHSKPSKAQVRKLRELLVRLVDTYNIPFDKVVPHRINDSTDCYGLKLNNVWAQRQLLIGLISSLRKRIRQLRRK